MDPTDVPDQSIRRREFGFASVAVHVDSDMVVADVSHDYRTLDILGPSRAIVVLFFHDRAGAKALRDAAEAIMASYPPEAIDPGPIATIEHQEGER